MNIWKRLHVIVSSIHKTGNFKVSMGSEINLKRREMGETRKLCKNICRSGCRFTAREPSVKLSRNIKRQESINFLSIYPRN